MSLINCGLHICEQYISWNRTSAMYSFFLTSVLLVLKVRLIRPRVWYALVIMILYELSNLDWKKKSFQDLYVAEIV